MIKRMIMSVAALFFSWYAFASAHTAAETNEIVRAMLLPLLVRPHYDSATHTFVSLPIPVSSQDDFFTCRPGWNSEELRGAFDWYLESLPDAPSILPGFADPVAEAAIVQCDAMSYTNALCSIEAYVRGSQNTSKKNAALFVAKYHVLDDGLMDFVSSIVTNYVKYSPLERNAAFVGYAERLESENNSLSKEAGLAFLHENRFDLAGAVAIDAVLATGYGDYGTSTGRLATAIGILSDTNAWDGVRAYFSAVTNELHSSGVMTH